MTYNQTVKKINELKKLLNAKAETEIAYVAPKTICEGHGIFRDTNEVCLKYKTVGTTIITGKNRVELQKMIDALEDSIKDEKERRAKEAKAKRYKKELEEINQRKAYLEKWLAENQEI